MSSRAFPQPCSDHYSGAEDLSISPPLASDGAAVHALVGRCPPLDRNSLYCNLLQCTHFAATCALARHNGKACGFVSAYIPPAQPEVLFVWQVAVDASMRGTGLARRLIHDILARPSCHEVTTIHTTVTRSNQASRAMFAKLAASLATDLNITAAFDRHLHLAGNSESEELLAIGPFDRARS